MPRNPAATRQSLASGVATVLLACSAVLGGVWFAATADIVRVNVIDARLAYDVGYNGEVTQREGLWEPRGLDFAELMYVPFGATALALFAFPLAVVTRRALGDPAAVRYALGTTLVASLPGFVWLSLDWVPLDAQADIVKEVARVSDLWMPVLIALAGAGFLTAWWRTCPGPAAGVDDRLDDRLDA
ncbi:hypothetical protein [Nocardioides sp. J54]|uniref:hypothetical protein n=1 Tax=Nocardioides sp. J54 TaxID=935866 RepID=UPI0004B023D8|nr:hypothetical protein [Nocardioides sp. J54]